MPKVSGPEKDKTARQIEFDLEQACKKFLEARHLSVGASNEIILLMRVLAEELLRWRVL